MQALSTCASQRTARLARPAMRGGRLLSRLARQAASQHARSAGQLQVRSVLENAVTEEEPHQAAGLGFAPAGPCATTAAGAPTRTPADIDRERFQLHWSVDMWREYIPSQWFNGLAKGEEPATERLRRFTETLRQAVSTAGIFGSTEAARYWAYHLSRLGFFAFQGITSLLVARETSPNKATDAPARTRVESLFKGGFAGPLGDAMLTFYQDYELIKEGKYALPWDMVTVNRQFNPLWILYRSTTFLAEAAQTLARRDRGEGGRPWLKSALLPGYYEQGFHYQTDGWLSSASAAVYETSTETLFIGRQYAMQRTTLLHLSDYLAGKDASKLKALEVAAGTGRFATFVKDNHPQLHLTVSDLSPFYLQQARSNLAYWKKKRAPAAELGGVDGTGVEFLQTPAEAVDAPDDSFDVVYSVYLFHELPADVRAKAAAEMARVVKPGGLVVLTDSCQLGDRKAFDPTLGNFQNFNEPHYGDYIQADLGALFEAAGLVCGGKVLSSSTKSLSFFKPAASAVHPVPLAGPPAATPLDN